MRSAVRDDRALSAPDDRDGFEDHIKACYVTYTVTDAPAAQGGLFGATVAAIGHVLASSPAQAHRSASG